MAFSSGNDFERVVETLFTMAGSCVRKTDPPVRVLGRTGSGFKGVFLKPGCLDFEGGFHGFFCGFDAKTCAGDRFSMRRIEGHQMERMEEIAADGGFTGAIIQYEEPGAGSEVIFLVPYRTILALLADGARSITRTTALHLTDDKLQNRCYQLDRYNFDLFEAVLAAELARVMEERKLTQQ